MSALNLDINPQVIVAQMGLFLVGVYTVKRLMLEPYGELRAKRDSQTSGDKELARQRSLDCDEKKQAIERQIAETFGRLKTEREKNKRAALQAQRESVEEGKREAEAILGKMRDQIKQNLEEEKDKKQSVVEDLSSKVFSFLISGS